MDKRQFYNSYMTQENGDFFFAVEQNKVNAYNQSQGEDDRTGIQCAACNNRGKIAFLNEEGKLAIRPCKCSGIRLTVSRLQRQGLYEVSKKRLWTTSGRRQRHRKPLKTLCRGS